MDGNGRWAEARGQPRHSGHREGVRPVRMCIEECARRKVRLPGQTDEPEEAQDPKVQKPFAQLGELLKRK